MKTLHKPLIIFTLLLSLFVILLYLCTPYKAQAVGSLLGLWVSYYNVLFISRKLRSVEGRVMGTAAGRPRGTGMLHRFSIVALAIMLAYTYPHWIDARTIAIGLPLCYVFLLVHQLVEVRRDISLGKG